MNSDKKLAIGSALASMMSVQGGASIAKYLFHLLVKNSIVLCIVAV